ncbi:hypothetical protein BSKO_10536 [Bryopsis sp. KO-2023]|nr:hypothetical protein BSKO_10536 [Bryopsis sp. KO-2023]
MMRVCAPAQFSQTVNRSGFRKTPPAAAATCFRHATAGESRTSSCAFHCGGRHDLTKPRENGFVSRRSPEKASRKERSVATEASLGEVAGLFEALKGGSSAVGAYLDAAPAWTYLIYMLAAGVGLPFSEDALVVWVASRMVTGFYSSWIACCGVIAIIYTGVVVSDLITFYMGVGLKKGLFTGLQNKIGKGTAAYDRAVVMIKKWSVWIGSVQRFSLGFRGPLCLVCGFMGVSAKQFLGGVALAAPLTMGLQFCAGYLLKDVGNVYLAALAVVAGPNLVGHALGPILTAVGLYMAGRKKPDDPSGKPNQQTFQAT